MGTSALASDLVECKNKKQNGDWKGRVMGKGREGSGNPKGCVPGRIESIVYHESLEVGIHISYDIT